MSAQKEGKVIITVAAVAAIVTGAILGLSFFLSGSTIHTLLTQNQALNSAIRNLTEETQIGYASLLSQETDSFGQVVSEVKFVQTAAGRPNEIVSEQIFRIQGDEIHFDALVVKFSTVYVKDGKSRALYLWRRVYGDEDTPSGGQMIHQDGESPERYHSISKSLKLKDQPVFWEAIWDLANNPQKLSEYGVSAVYGNTVYTKMETGKTYLFKINTSGQIYPEVLSYE